MPNPETAIRLIVIGQELLIAAVFLFGNGGRAARISGALLVLSLAGYLFTSDLAIRSSLPVLAPVALLLALAVPYCLWLFARAIFESPWPRPVFVIAGTAVITVVWGVYLAEDWLRPVWTESASVLMHIVALGIVAHALWIALKGRPDDLIEGRRSFRLLFVVIVSIQVAVVLLVELAQGAAALPAWLELANVIIIAVLTIGLATPMLRLNSEYFAPDRDTASAENAGEANALSAADSVLRTKLMQLMDEGVYRETGLTITVLGEKLKLPQHQLRRLINGHLGYRNFSAFLNSYRITEAKYQLADPERARTPVLTIALDLGYASLGPFNRAFKAATGTTPTDYRQKNVGRNSADSE